MVVVDHDTNRLLWAAPGRDKATLAGFFELLGPDRCKREQLAWVAATDPQVHRAYLLKKAYD